MFFATTNRRLIASLRQRIPNLKHCSKLKHQVLRNSVSDSSRSLSAAAMDKFRLPKRIQGSTNNVWNEYVALDTKYKPLNLGQGAPDEGPPANIIQALKTAVLDTSPTSQQYTRGFGHVRLIQAIAKLFSGLTNRSMNPQEEVLITIGAYEAIFSAIMGHVEEGDEVILIEPFFDCYDPIVKMAGGTPRYVTLRQNKTEGIISSSDFRWVDKELESAFNEKTKMIIINTPLNPLGKVYKREELEKIAALCRKWNVLCVSDEVYEWMVYDDNEHIRICTLPEMWERTITIGSAGKTFSVTGWKIGWAYGPQNMISNLRMIHQNCVYTCPRPIQEAVAINFEREMRLLDSSDSFLHRQARELQAKRDFMAKFLNEKGMNPIIPEGGTFMLADWSPLAKKIDLSSESDEYADFRFTKWMTKNVGLLGIPPSVFYSDSNKPIGEKLVRYCFIKTDDHLQKAAELLKSWEP